MSRIVIPRDSVFASGFAGAALFRRPDAIRHAEVRPLPLAPGPQGQNRGPGGPRPSALARWWRSAMRVAAISETRRHWRTVRYAAKCILRPLASLRWIEALEHSPLAPHIERKPRLILKPHRAYISRHYGFARRSAALLTHHVLTASLRSHGKSVEPPTGEEQVVAEIDGKHAGERYRVCIGGTDKFDREGEVMLSLREANSGELVQVLVFTLALRNDRPSLEIGCLQGGRTAQAQALIKRATKALHGIRPKNLLLDAVYSLADGWGMCAIYGISNASRVFGGKRVHADYDEFWRELGGVADHDGFFALPPTLPEKTDIPSNRRAEYRRRGETRAQLAAQIVVWVHGHPRPESVELPQAGNDPVSLPAAA
jgi:uncharacterized protein VirK/YbjX